MAIPTENNVLPDADQNPNKRRRKKSVVWEHFTLERINDECTRACCNQCKKSFAYISGSKIAGTSHLKRHIALGICPVSQRRSLEKHQSTPYITHFKTNGYAHTDLPKRRYKSTSESAYLRFDQDRCSHEIAKMIMLHEYPLHIVEHSGFVDFLRTLHPQLQTMNISTIQEECENIYQREKQRLLALLGGILGHINLALDLWTSDQGLGYVLLTSYFIDSDWKLQRRILNVVMLPFPDSEVAFNRAVIACLNGWNLDNKLFTLTIDQSFANEAVRRNLRGLLPNMKNSHILNGQLLLGNCYARVLSRLAKDALSSTADLVKKIRNNVKYVKVLEGNEELFIGLKQQLQNPSTKTMNIDDETKWNTTYHMLVAAFECKEVFSCLDTPDPNYIDTPSMEDWRRVEILCIYLKLLFDAANILNGPTNPTTDMFFHEVWKIQLELMHAAISQDTFISNLTKPLQDKFNSYWTDCNLVFALAVIMNPRYKMKLVDFSFSEIYGEDAETWIKVVNEGINELFHEYIIMETDISLLMIDDCEVVDFRLINEEEYPLLSGGGDFTEFVDQQQMQQELDQYLGKDLQKKSELDQYLEESLLTQEQDFDVLAWWKQNAYKYPVLSKMASDILCIPVSTVVSDSVFDIASRKMDSYYSSLRPSTIEAIICAKDWLQYQ